MTKVQLVIGLVLSTILFLTPPVVSQEFQDETMFDSCTDSTNATSSYSLPQQGGKHITAEGILNVLIVFASFADDTTYAKTHPDWPAGQAPTYMATLYTHIWHKIIFAHRLFLFS